MKKRQRQQNKGSKVIAIKMNIFAVLVLAIVLLLASYFMFIGLSIKNTVYKKDAEATMITMRDDISTLEREYLVRVGDLTKVRADDIGLKEVATKKFVQRRVLVGQAVRTLGNAY